MKVVWADFVFVYQDGFARAWHECAMLDIAVFSETNYCSPKVVCKVTAHGLVVAVVALFWAHKL